MLNPEPAWSTDAEDRQPMARQAELARFVSSASANSTPISLSLYQTKRHERIELSASNSTSKRSGMPRVLATFKQAPMGDKFRTVALITDWCWLRRMRADFRVRVRGRRRRSMDASVDAPHSRGSQKEVTIALPQSHQF